MQPETGKEYPYPNEPDITAAIVEIIHGNLERVYKKGHIGRQFHAKMHACIKGAFTVDASLPAQWQAGTFLPGKTYECWVRLSNGNTRVQDDRKADLRGFAIKLLGAPGPQLVQDISVPASHDFVMVSYPTLMAATPEEFKKAVKAVCGGVGGLIVFALNPANWSILFRTLQSSKKQQNLFATTYWSVSPYRFGNEQRAVKYKLLPATQQLTVPNRKGPDFFADTVVADLAKQNIRFDFMVQFQENPATEPLDDLTKEWKTPFVKIGSLVLPQQQFDPELTRAFGDNLTFSPWHTAEAHRPLGVINRMRREVYDVISKFRVLHNQKI